MFPLLTKEAQDAGCTNYKLKSQHLDYKLLLSFFKIKNITCVNAMDNRGGLNDKAKFNGRERRRGEGGKFRGGMMQNSTTWDCVTLVKQKSLYQPKILGVLCTQTHC